MAKYKIVEPCGYAQDGKGVQHTKPGAVVELSSATAKALGSKVERLGVTGSTGTALDGIRRTVRSFEPGPKGDVFKPEPEGDGVE